MSKKLYEQPTTKVLVVQFEGVLMQSGRFSTKGTEWISVDSEEDF